MDDVTYVDVPQHHGSEVPTVPLPAGMGVNYPAQHQPSLGTTMTYHGSISPEPQNTGIPGSLVSQADGVMIPLQGYEIVESAQRELTPILELAEQRNGDVDHSLQLTATAHIRLLIALCIRDNVEPPVAYEVNVSQHCL